MRSVRLITVAVLAMVTSHAATAQSSMPPAPRTDTASAAVLARADAAFAAQRWREAADLYQNALAVSDGAPERWRALGHALFNDNRRRESIAAYERALQLRAGAPGEGAWQIARAYAIEGNSKQALRWLQHAMTAGFDDREAIRREPAFGPYRDDPRFSELVDTGAAGFEPATSRVTAGRSAN